MECGIRSKEAELKAYSVYEQYTLARRTWKYV